MVIVPLLVVFNPIVLVPVGFALAKIPLDVCASVPAPLILPGLKLIVPALVNVMLLLIDNVEALAMLIVPLFVMLAARVGFNPTPILNIPVFAMVIGTDKVALLLILFVIVPVNVNGPGPFNIVKLAVAKFIVAPNVNGTLKKKTVPLAKLNVPL